MKYFKTEATHIAPRYEITIERYNKITERKYPFEQNNQQGKLSQYAICPSCLNPIQIIGVLHEVKTTPHGRHAGKTINGLPNWVYSKYEYCPYAKHNDRIEPNDDERLPELDDNIIELYNLLKSQFDRVVYFLGKELKIRCSSSFWEKALRQFIVNNVHCYPWLTEVNLPYIFAYFGIHHQSIFKQSFLKGTEIYNKLAEYPNVAFVRAEKQKADDKYEQLINQNGSFLKLFFRFTNHTNTATNGETLEESMLFCIDDRETGKTIFEQKIEFSETHFINMISKKENEKYRLPWILEIAEKLMKPLT